MQSMVEMIFDVVYLCTVIVIGVKMLLGNQGNRQFFLYGVMTVTLGFGDAFHLIPRAIAVCTTGLENYTVFLGIGKLITSITMTIFYVILYYVWRERYSIQGKIPFSLLGIWMIILFYRSSQQQNDSAFRYLWLTIVLSFVFYIPVALWADHFPLIGMLMIPKTCAYVWTVLIGYSAMKGELK